MARRGEKRTRPKRSPRVQAMQKVLRLLEQAVRLDALRIAMARRMPTKARAAFIARHVWRARQVRAARALMRSTLRSTWRGRPGQRDS
jgi:uncharacterized membrane protein YdbT with pleckstrin-like domain